MKKINRNNNDSYFFNKETIDESLKRIKPLIKNNKQTITAALLVGGLIASAGSVYGYCKDLVDTINYENIIKEHNEYLVSNNDKVIEKYNDEGVICLFNGKSNIEQEYSLIDKHIYNTDGEEISLEGKDNKVSFICCNIDTEVLNNINISKSLTKSLILNSSSVDDDCVNYFPETIISLSLDDCNYITNLNNLPEKCPNITQLSIDRTASLSDLSFIYRMNNLRKISINDSAHITNDLINYLDANDIKHNLTEEDVYNSNKIDEIISNIIEPTMNNDEKIRSICQYILNNMEYNESIIIESNMNPLTYALKENTGVCTSYAYLTNILLNKAGINSYKVDNDDHSWNMIKLNNKYYYIDNAEKDNKNLYNGILDCLTLSENYIVDTDANFMSMKTSPYDKETIIPSSLIETIKNGESDETIIEKYGEKISNYKMILAAIIAGVSIGISPILAKRTYDKTKKMFKTDDEVEEKPKIKHI